MRYVRTPGSKRTYGVNVKAELSTRFSDWIETNLLKLEPSHIRSVTFENHKVDPEQGAVVRGENLTISRKDGFGPWSLDKEISAGQELNSEKTSALSTALGDLKIVGVRPKPAGLSRDLKIAASNDVKPTSRADLQSLVSKGFYPTRDGLFSNQGDVVVRTDEGAVYTLRYGEVVFGQGEAIESGLESDKDKEKDKAKGDAKKPDGGTTENRFLMVTIAFDPSLVPDPEKPREELFIPDDPFQKAADDPKRIEEEKAAKEKADREKADRDRRLADAEKKVKALADRFADWYFVTPGESFRSIVLDRPALVRAKSDKPDAPAGFPGGAPNLNIPGFGGAGHP
jgi:hypothetical protein